VPGQTVSKTVLQLASAAQETRVTPGATSCDIVGLIMRQAAEIAALRIHQRRIE